MGRQVCAINAVSCRDDIELLTNFPARYFARWKRHRKVETEEVQNTKTAPSPSVSKDSPEPDDDDDEYTGSPNGAHAKPRSAARRKIVQDSPSLPSSPKSTMSYLSETSTVAPPLPPQQPTPDRKPVSKGNMGYVSAEFITHTDGQTPPEWLPKVADQIRAKYPNDRFEIIVKPRPAQDAAKPPEWRIKCLDWCVSSPPPSEED
jgi:hypothetical protein